MSVCKIYYAFRLHQKLLYSLYICFRDCFDTSAQLNLALFLTFGPVQRCASNNVFPNRSQTSGLYTGSTPWRVSQNVKEFVRHFSFGKNLIHRNKMTPCLLGNDNPEQLRIFQGVDMMKNEGLAPVPVVETGVAAMASSALKGKQNGAGHFRRATSEQKVLKSLYVYIQYSFAYTNSGQDSKRWLVCTARQGMFHETKYTLPKGLNDKLTQNNLASPFANYRKRHIYAPGPQVFT